MIICRLLHEACQLADAIQAVHPMAHEASQPLGIIVELRPVSLEQLVMVAGDVLGKSQNTYVHDLLRSVTGGC